MRFEGLYPGLGVAVMTAAAHATRLVDQESCKIIYHGEPRCSRPPTDDVLDETRIGAGK